MTLEPDSAALVWIDAQRAVIVRWDDEPIVEKLESGVPPLRRAAGSVRRGPARPYGGGRVGGHGTEGRHHEQLQRYFADVAEQLADVDFVEIAGRGQIHERFADALQHLVDRGDGKPEVTTRRLSRRPSDAQMAARFRRIVGKQLPRRKAGPYRPAPPDRTASGRLRSPGREGFRNPRPRHLLEHKEIEREIEMMLADDFPDR